MNLKWTVQAYVFSDTFRRIWTTNGKGACLGSMTATKIKGRIVRIEQNVNSNFFWLGSLTERAYSMAVTGIRCIGNGLRSRR